MICSERKRSGEREEGGGGNEDAYLAHWKNFWLQLLTVRQGDFHRTNPTNFVACTFANLFPMFLLPLYLFAHLVNLTAIHF